MNVGHFSDSPVLGERIAEDEQAFVDRLIQPQHDQLSGRFPFSVAFGPDFQRAEQLRAGVDQGFDLNLRPDRRKHRSIDVAVPPVARDPIDRAFSEHVFQWLMFRQFQKRQQIDSLSIGAEIMILPQCGPIRLFVDHPQLVALGDLVVALCFIPPQPAGALCPDLATVALSGDFQMECLGGGRFFEHVAQQHARIARGGRQEVQEGNHDGGRNRRHNPHCHDKHSTSPSGKVYLLGGLCREDLGGEFAQPVEEFRIGRRRVTVHQGEQLSIPLFFQVVAVRIHLVLRFGCRPNRWGLQWKRWRFSAGPGEKLVWLGPAWSESP